MLGSRADIFTFIVSNTNLFTNINIYLFLKKIFALSFSLFLLLHISMFLYIIKYEKN